MGTGPGGRGVALWQSQNLFETSLIMVLAGDVQRCDGGSYLELYNMSNVTKTLNIIRCVYGLNGRISILERGGYNTCAGGSFVKIRSFYWP